MIKKKFEGEDPKKIYQERNKDRLHRFLLADNTVRGFLVRGNRVVKEMKHNHSLGPLETLILGQTYLGALLMAANLKDEGRIRLQWECGGPVGGIDVEADNHGTVRGFLKNVPIPAGEHDGDRFPDLFGAGFLTVTRLTGDFKEPLSSTVMLKHGRIAEDLTEYYFESEQINTAMALSVSINNDGEPDGAGGLFLQALPGAPEEIITGLEQILEKLPSLGGLFASDKDADALILDLFAAYAPKFLDSGRVEFFCPCDKNLFAGYLRGLPEKDRMDIAENGPFPLEITCQNCSSKYVFEKSELTDLLK